MEVFEACRKFAHFQQFQVTASICITTDLMAERDMAVITVSADTTADTHCFEFATAKLAPGQEAQSLECWGGHLFHMPTSADNAHIKLEQGYVLDRLNNGASDPLPMANQQISTKLSSCTCFNACSNFVGGQGCC